MSGRGHLLPPRPETQRRNLARGASEDRGRAPAHHPSAGDLGRAGTSQLQCPACEMCEELSDWQSTWGPRR